MVKVMKSKRGKFVKIELINGRWYVFKSNEVEIIHDFNANTMCVVDKSKIIDEKTVEFPIEAVLMFFNKDKVMSVDYTFDEQTNHTS